MFQINLTYNEKIIMKPIQFSLLFFAFSSYESQYGRNLLKKNVTLIEMYVIHRLVLVPGCNPLSL